MAAGGPAAGNGVGLAASYAAVQSNLRKQFYGDLVELRGALLNTLSLDPQRAPNLHLKMHLIDSALHMLEESKPVVTNAELAQLMNMSAKVVRAVEAWRLRKPVQVSLPPGVAGKAAAEQVQAAQPDGRQELVRSVALDGHGAPAGARLSSPFGMPEVQAAAGGAAEASAATSPPNPLQPAGGAGVQDGRRDMPAESSMDRFDFLSKLVFEPGAQQPAGLPRSATLLPDIDWEVPEIKPSGNLDTLLPSEASQVLLQQQRTIAQHRAQWQLQRVSSAEAFLARMSAHAGDSGAGHTARGSAGAESVQGHAQQPSPSAPHSKAGQAAAAGGSSERGGIPLPPLPNAAVAGLYAQPTAAGGSGHAGVASLRSVGTSSQLDGPQQPEASSNSIGGSRSAGSGPVTTGGSAGPPSSGGAAPGAAEGSATPSPAALPQQAAAAAPAQWVADTPFAQMSVQQQHGVPPMPGAALQQYQLHGADVGVGGFGGLQALPTAQPGGGMEAGAYGTGAQAHNSEAQQHLGGGGGGSSTSLGMAAASATGAPMQLAGLQPLGLSDMLYDSRQAQQQQQQHAGRALQAVPSFSSAHAHAKMQAGRLFALQQFPHAALHAGGGGLRQLLGEGSSGGAPGGGMPFPQQPAAFAEHQQQQAQYQQLRAAQQQQAAGPPLHADGGGSGAAGFPGMPILGSAGSMGGLTITPGTQRILISTAAQPGGQPGAAAQQDALGWAGGGGGREQGGGGTDAVDPSVGSLGGACRAKRKRP